MSRHHHHQTCGQSGKGLGWGWGLPGTRRPQHGCAWLLERTVDRWTHEVDSGLLLGVFALPQKYGEIGLLGNDLRDIVATGPGSGSHCCACFAQSGSISKRATSNNCANNWVQDAFFLPVPWTRLSATHRSSRELLCVGCQRR